MKHVKVLLDLVMLEKQIPLVILDILSAIVFRNVLKAMIVSH